MSEAAQTTADEQAIAERIQSMNESFTKETGVELDGVAKPAEPAAGSADQAQRAAPAEAPAGNAPKDGGEEARAEAKPDPAKAPEGEAGKPAEPDKPKTEDKPKSRWQQRQEELAEKARKTTEEAERLKQERAAFEAERQAFKAKQSEPVKPKITPEMAENAAARYEETARTIEAAAEQRALKLEANGQFDEADQLREQAKQEAAEARFTAKQCREFTKTLKAEQPAQPAANAPEVMERWATETRTKFPDVAKGGPAHEEYVSLFRANAHLPGEALPYLAQWAIDRTQRRAAEGRAGALEAERAKLDKSVKDLTAEVQRLQALVQPGGGGVIGEFGRKEQSLGDIDPMDTTKQIEFLRSRIAA